MPEGTSRGRQAKEFFVLDRFTVGDIRKWISLQDEILRMHWDFYSHLAYKRSKVLDRLKAVLLEAAERDYRFERYQRVVMYGHSLEPLAVGGSLIDPGGRFNIGDINPRDFPFFPALYLAEDRETAMQEALCVSKGEEDPKSDLDFALAKRESIVVVSVSGRLESVINLNNPDRLSPFVDLIRGFDMPKEVLRTSMKYKIPLEVVRTVDKLVQNLLNPNWRAWPMQFDVPATSQIFGHLVVEAGIEGIIYPSIHNRKSCLAVYPQNFRDTESYAELDDRPPHRVQFRRLDSSTWRNVACAQVPTVDIEELRTLFPRSAIRDLIGKIRNLRLVRNLFGGRRDN